ncbi:MAG: DsbA family protein [Acidobacteriota bacterium]|nr:DsbA family protein [Acidobacteriota bacterium]
MKRLLYLAVILCGLAAGTLAGLWVAGRGPFRRALPVETAKDLSAAPEGAVPPHVRGPVAATVTVEEFGDFQCPPCGQLEPELKKIQEEHGTDLRLVFRQYPLNGIHPHALEAAQASEAAALQGKFWEMHDLLFERQAEWAGVGRPRFVEYALSLGLDAERFARDMDAEQVLARISADEQRGDAAGVRATPSLFVNGRELPLREMTPEGLRAAVNAILRR